MIFFNHTAFHRSTWTSLKDIDREISSTERTYRDFFVYFCTEAKMTFSKIQYITPNVRCRLYFWVYPPQIYIWWGGQYLREGVRAMENHSGLSST